MADEVMTEAEFDAAYDPQPAADGGLLEYEDVRHLPANRVWTVVTGDDDAWYAAPGFHVVNRLGYLTSVTPWPEGERDALWCPPFEDLAEEQP